MASSITAPPSPARMRVAWFRPAPTIDRHLLDDTASLLDELSSTHEVVMYHETNGHDFVWQHARRPFDACVYEMSDSPASTFIWPYVLHYPGLLRLRSESLQTSRTHALRRSRRLDHLAAELAFGGATRIPLLASKLVVVGDACVAETLRAMYPGSRIRYTPPGISPARQVDDDVEAAPVFAVLDTTRVDSVERAAARARDQGSNFALLVNPDVADAVSRCQAIVAMPWPPGGEPPTAALLAMSASRVAIVYETGATAGWPALNPQTWQPRGLRPGVEPVAVSIDPRDEEHSLMLTFRRLAGDAPLRQRLGAAAHAFWQAQQATPAAAAAAWRSLLEEATDSPAPARPAGWPVHLTADGSERTRAMLADFGVSVDFLDQ